MDSYSKRKNIIIFIFLFIGIIFIIRLFGLQVINSAYKKSATQNVVREVIDYPSRGLIFDRNGELLVYNQAVYDLMATPREIGIFDTTSLCNYLKITKTEFNTELKKAKAFSKSIPSAIIKQVSPESYALLQEKMYKYPGFYFQTRTLRNYQHNIAAHVLGYIGEVSQTGIKKDPYYRMGDYVGISGIEGAYEKELRGKKGVSLYLVDVHNRVKGSYNEGLLDTSSIKGNNLISTLDWKLQEYGELLMQNKAGSIVAIEPSTGEILTLVSSPKYKPEVLVGRNRIENFPRLLSDTLLPLFNRATSAQYPPGSTFKMLHGLIALQENAITPFSQFSCNHGYQIGNFHQACHHQQSFSLNTAISQSCNAYFSQTFRRILDANKFKNAKEGYMVWRKHVLSFGFGNRVSIEFNEEVKGFIPAAEYYDKKTFNNSKWHSLSLVSLAIGQGEIQTTPMQMANYASILANRGFYFSPHVIRKIEGKDVNPEINQKKFTTIDRINFEIIMDGMEGVITGGTGSGANVPGITICGKTGTAQNSGVDHSTFIAFAPRDNPKIAIAVYVENGKWGNTYAAPIASLIIEKYLNDTIQPSRTWLETKMIESNLLYPYLPNYIKYYKN